MPTAEEIAAMTGAQAFGKKLVVSEITFNGDEGHFYYRDKDAKKDEKTGKFPKTDLGDSLELVFMKIRRKLSFYKPKGGLSTSEHNSKTDFVVLYGAEPQDRGTADEIRERHPELRTIQNIYAFYGPKKEVVRFVIKGASLNTQDEAVQRRYKNEGIDKFYVYLQKFDKENPLHMFFSKMSPLPEEGPKGTYYAMRFERGEKLTDEQQQKVNDKIVEIHTLITEADASFLERAKQKGQYVAREDTDEEEGMPTIQADEDPLAAEFEQEDKAEYPDENINPEDIPF